MTVKCFENIIFKEDFNINHYNEKEYKFINCVFKKNVDFSEYEFSENIEFINIKYEGNITFKNSTFNKNLSIIDTTFTLNDDMKKIFEGVRFNGQNLIISNSKNLPRMDGISFSDYSKFIFRNARYDKSNYIHGKMNYKIARNQANKIGDYENFGHYYYMERYLGGKVMNPKDYPTYKEFLTSKFFDILSRYTVGYGEKPWKILYISIFIISIFAFFYMFIGLKSFSGDFIGIDINKINTYSMKEMFNVYVDMWYFSMVTFSTVGYGDMIMVGVIGKILVCIEVFFGITIAATWASVVINKMIR